MSDQNRHILRSLEIPDLSQVAELHRRAFRDSALTKLGLEPVRRYYEWQLTGPHDIISIGVFNSDGELMGFCFAGIFRGALSGFLKQNQKFLTTWLLKHPWLIFNSIVFDRVRIALKSLGKHRIVTTKTKTDKTPKVEKSYGVLSIATDPLAQGSGIGKQLMDAIEQHARNEGFSQLHLTVHPENNNAINFYIKCGWEKSISSEPWSGRMVKTLSP